MDDDFDRLMTPLDPAVLIVTASVGTEQAGCVVGFHSQCSIEPPRLAVWLSQVNHTYAVARRATHLGVHVLAEGQSNLAELFGGTTGDSLDKFAQCAWTPAAFGVPMLDDCARRGVFVVIERHELDGDHDLFVLAPIEVQAPDAESVMRVASLDVEPGHPVPPE